MFIHRLASIVVLSGVLLGALVLADDNGGAPGLGKVLDAATLAEKPQVIFADGTGLPIGKGNSKLGEEVYSRECVICHGPEGIGGSAMELVGDRTLLGSDYPDKGIAVYWPYGPPLYDYIRRSMPPTAPYSLSVDEVYSVIAYLLERSDLLAEGVTLDASNLSSINMPNKDNFTDVYTDQ